MTNYRHLKAGEVVAESDEYRTRNTPETWKPTTRAGEIVSEFSAENKSYRRLIEENEKKKYRILEVGEEVSTLDEFKSVHGDWYVVPYSFGIKVSPTNYGSYRRPIKEEEKQVRCKFEVGKEYKTRDGRTAKIYAIYTGCQEAIHGAVLGSDNSWRSWTWFLDGRFNKDGVKVGCDLVIPPREWEVWVKDEEIMPNNNTKAFQDLVKASGWKKIKVREVLEDE